MVFVYAKDVIQLFHHGTADVDGEVGAIVVSSGMVGFIGS